MIDTSLPGMRRLPAWLFSHLSSVQASKILLRWDDDHWGEIVRDTPEETWLAIALHPRSRLLESECGYASTDDSGRLYCSLTNTQNRAFLGLMMTCWEALRDSTVSPEDVTELRAAEDALSKAQARIRAVSGRIPHEVLVRLRQGSKHDE